MLVALAWFLGSAMIADLAGYWLHRWAHKPRSPLFRAHMTHHLVNYPPSRVTSSKYQTSGSDSLVLWFAPFLGTYLLILAALPVVSFWPAALGAITIAALSSAAHDLTHLTGSPVWRWPFLRGIAVRHHSHHFKMHRNLGILFSFWDVIFGTRKPPRNPPHSCICTKPMT